MRGWEPTPRLHLRMSQNLRVGMPHSPLIFSAFPSITCLKASRRFAFVWASASGPRWGSGNWAMPILRAHQRPWRLCNSRVSPQQTHSGLSTGFLDFVLGGGASLTSSNVFIYCWFLNAKVWKQFRQKHCYSFLLTTLRNKHFQVKMSHFWTF